MKNFWKVIGQKGSLMVEALAMLGLISMVTPILYKKAAERTSELQDIASAAQIRTVVKGLEDYMKDNYNTLVALPEGYWDNDTLSLTMDDLKEYLPYGFSADTKTFSKFDILIKRQMADADARITLSGFVGAPIRNDMPKPRVSKLAAMIGGNGALIEKPVGSDKLVVEGVQGAWGSDDPVADYGLDAKDYANASVAASTIYSVSASSKSGGEDLLHRTDQHDNGVLNTMLADLRFSDSSDMVNVNNMIAGANGISILPNGQEEADDRDDSLLFVGGKSKITGLMEAASANVLGEFNAAPLTEGGTDYILHAADGTIEMGGGADNAPYKINFSSDGTVKMKASNSATMAGQEVYLRTDADMGDLSKGSYLALNRCESGAGCNGFKVAARGNALIETNDNGESNAVLSMGSGGAMLGGRDFAAVGDMDMALKSANRLLLGDTIPQTLANYMSSDLGMILETTKQGYITSPKQLQMNSGNANIVLTPDLGVMTINDGYAKATSIEMQPSGMAMRQTVENDYAAIYVDSSGIELDSSRLNRTNIASENLSVTTGEREGGNVNFTSFNDVNFRTKNKFFSDAYDMELRAYGGNGTSLIRGGVGSGTSPASLTMSYEQNGMTASTFLGPTSAKMGISNVNNASSYVEIAPKHFSNKLAYGGSFTVNTDGTTNSALIDVSENGTFFNNVFNNVRQGPPIAMIGADGVDVFTDDALTYFSPSSDRISISRSGAIGVPTAHGSSVSGDVRGLISADRFVANGDYTADLERKASGQRGSVPYDKYMVDPAYTSVMHDIKLTTRGGARLSDILPEFINKGIYVIDNTYTADSVKDWEKLVPTSSGVISGPQECTSNNYACETSPWLGFIPTPQCPPGYSKVVTIAPIRWKMSEAYKVVSDVAGADFQNRFWAARYPARFNPSYSTGLGSASSGHTHSVVMDSDPGENGMPLTFQTNTWLNTTVSAARGGADSDKNASLSEEVFMGWHAVMGFLYIGDYYSQYTQEIGKGDLSGQIIWNLFPVYNKELVALSNVYCYFDRRPGTTAWNSSVVDTTYDQMQNIRTSTDKSADSKYLERLHNPTLDYDDPW